VEAGKTRLRFTAQTWMEILNALKARGGGHLMGWWHSHPFADPQDEGPKRPSRNACFLSSEDLFVHEAFFPHPYQVALVVDPQGKGSWGLFGWQDARIQEKPWFLRKEGR